jgi:hypothetical protein
MGIRFSLFGKCSKRETITELLGEEEAKLRAINAERKRQRS